MVAPVIDSLPTAPQRTDLPATFSDRADAFVAALQPFRNQLNDALAWQNLTFEATDQALNQANQARDASQSAAANAEQSNQESQAAKDLSQQWAESDDPVEGGRSSKYWKEQAEVVAAAVQSAAGLPSLAGNGLNVLTVNADEQSVEWLPGVQSLYSEFTESGTFTPDPAARVVHVELIGGGGSGAADNSSAGGGGGGAYAEKIFLAADLAASIAITVGAGGEGIIYTPNNSLLPGNDGGDTTFGSLLIARGGKGATLNGGDGGGGELGAIIAAASSAAGGYSSGGGGTGSRGQGGSCVMGGGGGGGKSSSTNGAGGESSNGGSGGDANDNGLNGSSGEFPGGGGSGAVSFDVDITSGAGADGLVRIRQW